MNVHDRVQALLEVFQPHRLVKDSWGCLWETISYPWAAQCDVAVDIRIPGDPTSVITVEVSALDPEGGQTCVCDRASGLTH